MATKKGSPRVREEQRQIGMLQLRADVVPESLDTEGRTFEIIWSTGAAVLRGFWEPFYEELSMDPAHIRMGRFQSNRAPYLDAHNSYDNDAVLGVLENARIEDGRGAARVRMTKGDARADAIFNKVAQRILSNVSVGYRVHRYVKTEGGEGTIPTYRAVDWEPLEASQVPVGADADSYVRSQRPDLQPCVVVTRSEGTKMAKKNGTLRGTRSVTDENEDPIRQRVDDCDCDQLDPDDDPDEWEECECDDAERSVEGETKEQRKARMIRNAERCTKRRASKAKAARAAKREKEHTEREIGRKEERARATEIRRRVRLAKLPESMAERLIDEEVSLEDATAQVMRALEEEDGKMHGERQTLGAVTAGADRSDKMLTGIRAALDHRANPKGEVPDAGREYRGLRLLEQARYWLEARGIRTGHMGPMELAGVALGMVSRAGMNSSSDYAYVLADVANKSLRNAYVEAPQTFAPITRRVPLNDFKQRNVVQLGEAPALAKVLEGAEYTRGTVGNGKEVYQLATYGKTFPITRQALINDDLGAFTRIPELFGRSARDLEGNLVWSQLLSNGNMGDGTALFHANHANLDSVAAVISVATLGKARAAMRVQKGLDGKQFVNLTPTFLIVPAAQETLADQIVSTALLAQQTSNVNVFAGRLQVIAEPRLDLGVTIDVAPIAGSTTAWYLAASPNQIDMIEFGYLDGQEGPYTESRVGFDVDGMEIKVRQEIAAKVIDWRGFYKNPGV